MRTRTIYLSILFIYSAILYIVFAGAPVVVVISGGGVVLFVPFIIVLLWLLCFAAAGAFVRIQWATHT